MPVFNPSITWQGAFVAALRNTNPASLSRDIEIAETAIRLALDEQVSETQENILRNALVCLLIIKAVRLGSESEERLELVHFENHCLAS